MDERGRRVVGHQGWMVPRPSRRPRGPSVAGWSGRVAAVSSALAHVEAPLAVRPGAGGQVRTGVALGHVNHGTPGPEMSSECLRRTTLDAKWPDSNPGGAWRRSPRGSRACTTRSAGWPRSGRPWSITPLPLGSGQLQGRALALRHPECGLAIAGAVVGGSPTGDEP